ncbi:hypothetical protein [Streptomyces sp. NPDC007205]|uniref:hypothetical protein n=1 Tax=Streptomyces sp. NPDC007205 TaxID=3154316 RepID=UPI0033C5584C
MRAAGRHRPQGPPRIREPRQRPRSVTEIIPWRVPGVSGSCPSWHLTAGASLVLGSKNGFGPPKIFHTQVTSGSIGDVDGDGYGDVVLGAGLEGYQPKGVVGGSIVVNYGSAGGVSTTRTPVRISQDTAGVPGTGEKYDRFGYDLDTGDVNGTVTSPGG